MFVGPDAVDGRPRSAARWKALWVWSKKSARCIGLLRQIGTGSIRSGTVGAAANDGVG